MAPQLCRRKGRSSSALALGTSDRWAGTLQETPPVPGSHSFHSELQLCAKEMAPRPLEPGLAVQGGDYPRSLGPAAHLCLEAGVLSRGGWVAPTLAGQGLWQQLSRPGVALRGAGQSRGQFEVPSWALYSQGRVRGPGLRARLPGFDVGTALQSHFCSGKCPRASLIHPWPSSLLWARLCPQLGSRTSHTWWTRFEVTG